MSYHAKLSPSSASRWTDCTASIGAQEGLSDSGSEASRLGTCCHQLSAECLADKLDPQTYLGRVMVFWATIFGDSGEDWTEVVETGEKPFDKLVQHRVTVTQEMIDACVVYINYVDQQVELLGGELFVEQRVPIGHITGEFSDEGVSAGGTSDAIIVLAGHMTTIDAKFGRAKVMAYDTVEPAGLDIMSAEPTPPKLRINLQLAFYLLGSLEKYQHLSPVPIKTVTATIVQPYLSHVSEYTCTVDELMAVSAWLVERAEATRIAPVFSPSQDNCHFCKAKLTCTARTHEVLSTALDGFDDVQTATPAVIKIHKLGTLYEKLGMIRQWCSDVESEVYNQLDIGNPVVNDAGLSYKLVMGKKGNREFDDDEAVTVMMKKMRITDDVMYTKKLISAAQAEKLSLPTKKGKTIIAEPVLGKTQWARLSAHITQRPGSPSVAIETDPRPAIVKANVDFDDVPQVADDCDEMFSPL